jgi:hypothetical protein
MIEKMRDGQPYSGAVRNSSCRVSMASFNFFRSQSSIASLANCTR